MEIMVSYRGDFMIRIAFALIITWSILLFMGCNNDPVNSNYGDEASGVGEFKTDTINVSFEGKTVIVYPSQDENAAIKYVDLIKMTLRIYDAYPDKAQAVRVANQIRNDKKYPVQFVIHLFYMFQQ